MVPLFSSSCIGFYVLLRLNFPKCVCSALLLLLLLLLLLYHHHHYYYCCCCHHHHHHYWCCKCLLIALQKRFHFLCIYNKMLQKCVHLGVVSCLYFGYCHLRSVCIHRCQAGMLPPCLLHDPPKKCTDYFHTKTKL